MTTSDLALPPWLGLLIGLSVCGFAFWKGEWPERTTAIGFLCGWAGTVLLRDRSYAGPQWAGFAISIALLALLIYLALKSGRNWLLCAASFQLLALVTHAARILDRTVGAWAYITAGVIWSYALVFSLAFGAWQCVVRRRGRGEPGR